MPDMCRVRRQLDPLLFAVGVKQADLDRLGDLRRYGEIGALRFDAGTERVRAPNQGRHPRSGPEIST